MSVKNFIPEIWSASVKRSFERASVFASCISREYAGELKNQGDTVRVPFVSPVEVREYQRNGSVTYDLAAGSTLDITVNNCLYFGIKADDLDTVQSSPNFLDAATKSGGHSLMNAVDVDCGKVLADGASIKLYETTPFPAAGGANSVIRILSELSKTLDEADVPRSGRWCVLPPAIANELSVELVGKTTPDTEVVSEGWISRAMGFDLFMSNNCPKNAAGNTLILAGVREAGTLITQIEKVESLRDTNSFADIVRGLMLWQAAVLLPSGIVSAAVDFG